MEIQSRTVKGLICILVNIIVLFLLYHVPIENNVELCLYKKILGRECWNCGMTRAFLSVIHGNFKEAYSYNFKVIFVFPAAVVLYSYSWYKYIFKNSKKGQ